MTVDQALAAARAAGLERLDAQLLLGHCLGRERTWLLAHGEAELSGAEELAFEALVARRADGEPLAHLVGHKEFHGLRLEVDRSTLVPRPETETLVEWALEVLPAPGPAAPRVLDLGTGSGAIALALKHRRPDARVCATDASAAALAVARRNGERLSLEVEWRLGDWWEPVAGRRFDLVVANPPYVAADDPHLAALRHEPRSALVAGASGLDDLRRLVALAPRHLETGGRLLLEHGHEQADEVRRQFASTGWEDVETRSDLAGLPRCTGGLWRS